jgi:NAD(P)-dependent dehydrogenase (short-subunit alcohol dehydrogenase family)
LIRISASRNSFMPKTFVVTGATSGIGQAAAEQLSGTGALVFGVGRSQARCEAAESRIRAVFPQADVHYLAADLSLQSQVRRLADQVRAELAQRHITALDGLINDAGAFTWRRRETSEGFEMQWAVNHLAPFLLTNELLPLFEKSEAARVVTVSSNSHFGARLHWNDLQLRRGYNGWLAYKQSKLCNVYFTVELRRRLGEQSPVRAFAADPGLVHTDIGLKNNPALIRWFWGWWSKRGLTPPESARGIVFLANDPSIAGRPEVYWRHSHPVSPNPRALDPEEAKKLWDLSAEMCQL